MNATWQLLKKRVYGGRRGAAVLIVLGIMSVALAVSFAMLRTQAGVQSIAANALRKERARQAAQTGLQHALRLMQSNDWEGVATTVQRNIAQKDSFTVEFATGDAELLPSSPLYNEYPFRVTVTVTGAACDPVNPQAVTTHKTQAVVQLVRKEFAPSLDLSSIANQTITQITSAPAYVEVPVRVEGPVYLEGGLRLCTDYPEGTSPLHRLLDDLELMRTSGKGDHRPFNGPVTLAGATSSDAIILLRDHLNVPYNSIPSGNSSAISVGSPSSYTLYPGGRSYPVQDLTSLYGTTVSSTTIQPDPVDNPLGLFRTSSSLTLNNNVVFRGMLVTGGYQPDLLIAGDNVSLLPVSLPSLAGATTSRQLPTAVVNDDFRLYSGCQNCVINGLLTTTDDFEFRKGAAATSATVTGNIVCSNLKLYGRTEWDAGASNWNFMLFLYQLAVSGGYSNTFPEWLATVTLDYEPKLIIKQPAVAPQYHWQDFAQPVYKELAGDDGLRWSVIRVRDIP